MAAKSAAGDDRRSASAGSPVDELSYTEASRELDSIVEFFEQREVDVDQLVAKLERATAIVDELDRRIKQTRMQVEELAPRLEAAARGESADSSQAGYDDDELGDHEMGSEYGAVEDPDADQPLF